VLGCWAVGKRGVDEKCILKGSKRRREEEAARLDSMHFKSLQLRSFVLLHAFILPILRSLDRASRLPILQHKTDSRDARAHTKREDNGERQEKMNFIIAIRLVLVLGKKKEKRTEHKRR
jgi:hypothetical protein